MACYKLEGLCVFSGVHAEKFAASGVSQRARTGVAGNPAEAFSSASADPPSSDFHWRRSKKPCVSISRCLLGMVLSCRSGPPPEVRRLSLQLVVHVFCCYSAAAEALGRAQQRAVFGPRRRATQCHSSGNNRRFSQLQPCASPHSCLATGRHQVFCVRSESPPVRRRSGLCLFRFGEEKPLLFSEAALGCCAFLLRNTPALLPSAGGGFASADGSRKCKCRCCRDEDLRDAAAATQSSLSSPSHVCVCVG